MLTNIRIEDCCEAYEEVLGVNVTVLGKVEILLRDEDTLTEEVFVDLLAVGLGNQHLDDRLRIDVDLGDADVPMWIE